MRQHTNIFIAEPLDGKIPKDELAHIKVNRVCIGDPIGIVNGQGVFYEATMTSRDTFSIQGSSEMPKPTLKAYLPMLKSSPHSHILRSILSFPIGEICLINTDNTVVKRRWEERDRKLLREGMKQSKNPWMPILSGPHELSELELSGVIAWGSCDALAGEAGPYDEIESVIWGPEGGFSSREKQILQSKCIPLNLSPYIMRAETAAFALLSYATASNLKNADKKGKING